MTARAIAASTMAAAPTRHVVALLLALATALIGAPLSALADVGASQELLVLGRVESLVQRQQWDAAAAELGQLPKEVQEAPAVKQYVRTVLPHLYAPLREQSAIPRPTASAATPTTHKAPRVTAQSRITHRHMDAEQRSDQTFDERGWQYNNQFVAEEDAAGWRHVLRASLDGYQDGKDDLRAPRQFSYQARREGTRITVGDVRNYLTHHKIVDPSNPLSSYTGYTLRSTQLRGLDLQLNTAQNDFHVMAGFAPYFSSQRDQYIYPRQIYGIRDSYTLTPWYRAAVGASYVRDHDERTEHIDPAIQPRETSIVSFEQDLTIIPGHWTVNTENAYSVTDDNLRPDGRFGQNVKLKDFAHSFFSEWRWPVGRVLGSYERIGPDFRAPSDIAATGVINSKNVSADREHVTLRVYPRPMGPLYGDFLYARTRNNLADDSDVEMTREHWFTATGGLQLPPAWPQPDVRATFIHTLSVPGNRFSPDYRWVYDLSGNLRKRWAAIDWSSGYQYLERANDKRTGFDDEYRRTWTLQAGRALWPGGYATTRGAWTRAQDLLNNATMRHHTEQEGSVTISSRLWSTASLSAGYTYQDYGAPIVVAPELQAPAGGILQGGGIVQTVSSSLMWPYTKTFRHDRRLQLIPSLHFHYSVASDDLERHPTIGARMTMRYVVRDTWRWEFMLEHRQDDDAQIARVHSQEWRGWLVLTSKFGPAISDEAPLR